MNAISQRDFSEGQKEKRSQFRIGVVLPALALVGATKISISIVNIAVQGAMIETATILQKGARLAINCGTIGVMARVVWRGPNRQYGLRFERTLGEREIDEQIARSSAVSSRRDKRPSKRASPAFNSPQA